MRWLLIIILDNKSLILIFDKRISFFQVVEEYERREKRIQQLTEEEVRKGAAVTAHDAEIQAIRDQWLTPLQELIGRINDNFGHYFKEIQCAGEVDLSIPDNPVCNTWYHLADWK